MNLRRVIGIALVFVACGTVAQANPASRELRRQGYEQVSQLDYDRALATFRRAIAADPTDPACYRAIAQITWMNLLFRRGALTVDDYLGTTTRPSLNLKQPPAEMAAIFHDNLTRAMQLAEATLRSSPGNSEARFEVGAAVAQLAAYTATVEGGLLSGFKAARRAFDEHERVLNREPGRKDAGFIVGAYRYIVANLALPLRVMAYVVGFGGDRDRGIRLVEGAAHYASDLQTDAKIALVFIYNRERRFDDASRVLRDLRRLYPKNRLFWLEGGATALRAGRASDAEALLTEGIKKLAGDTRPRAFGEEALWHYKLGATLVVLGRREDARRALSTAHSLPSRDWVRGRTHTEVGKLQDLAGNRVGAKAEYVRAMALCERDNDTIGAREARRFLQNR